MTKIFESTRLLVFKEVHAKALSANDFLTSHGDFGLKEEFERMPFDEKVSYLVENYKNLPDELTAEGVKVLATVGETEFAVVLARDKGLIDEAIAILVDTKDYLWAALIAKNAGRAEESENLYRDGLEYYVDNEMFGRAISAATALKLPPDDVDALFRRGVEVESRGMDLTNGQRLIDCAMASLEMALIGRDDDISKQVKLAMYEDMEMRAKKLQENDQKSEG